MMRPEPLMNVEANQLVSPTTRAPSVAAPSPATANPGTSQATITSEIPFTTSRNSPSVSTVIGRVRNSSTGRTMGLFLLVVNGISLVIVAWLVPGFAVAGLGAATLGALVVGLTSWFASTFISGSGRIMHFRKVEVRDRRLDG